MFWVEWYVKLHFVFSLICPNITGCNQENEKEILLLGGVCKPERSQGVASFSVFLSLIFHILYASAYIYSLISPMAVITENESCKYCEAEGSYTRMWHSVPCFWVHGECLDFVAYWWLM